MRVSFADFDLDTTTFELRRDGVRVPMEPQVFDVLAYLVRHRDRVVHKTELLDVVWGDRFVSDSALTSRIKRVRQALGDDGRSQRWVKTVHGRGYRFAAEASETAAPAVDDPAGGMHNLPTERTPLFGRTEAIVEVGTLLGRHRLVSLLGMGGAGKTRLATSAGRRVLDRFPDGVWFVDLVSANDRRSVDTAIARVAGVALSPGDARPQLARTLATRDALFIMDNCEHVRDDVAATLDHLLEHTSGPRFLVTSREPLNLPDERQVPVPPLTFDDLSAPAVALFIASAERFGATVPERDHVIVQRICRHLDGLPLAIELAAAQLRLLRPAEVADRLDQRFELLRAPRSGRERHESLMSVLESSLAMLDPGERELLGRLSAFPGPFDLADVEQLCDDLAAGEHAVLLAHLVDRSLVVSTSADERRFRLLETVRLFARRQTGAERHERDHARWCLGRVGDAPRAHLYDFDLAEWCLRHHDDIRAAQRHLVAAGRAPDAALLIAGTAFAMHTDTGARAAEVLQWVDGLLDLVDEPATAARLRFTGVFAGMAVRSPAAIDEHGREALRAARASGSPELIAVALVLASWTTVFTDPARAVAMVEEAAGLADVAGEPATRNFADSYRAFHLAMMRRYDEAVAQAEIVVARSGAPAGYGHDTFVAVVALVACCCVSEPERVRGVIEYLLTRLDPEHAMWANQVVAAAMHAAAGESAKAAALVVAIRARLDRAGQASLPDLLVPAAALAHRLGERDRADRWLRAIRAAGRPTQSFQVTFVYRRLREVVESGPDGAPPRETLEEIGDEAIGWMRAAAGR
ncbi:MAG TPA: winged helix-turn-helix domain-containing protein [Actinophytocola sp.]|nr:winged helix-turn-helix domain-containing protein [Actinophytocola sp.]